MRTYYLLLIFLCIMFTLHSCTKRKNEEDFRNLFKNNSNLSLKPFDIQFSMMNPGRIYCYKDSLLLFEDLCRFNDFTRFYRKVSLQEGELLGCLVPQGSGPNEVTFSKFVSFGEGKFYVYELNRARMGIVYLNEAGGPVNYIDGDFKNNSDLIFSLAKLRNVYNDRFIGIGLLKQGMYAMISRKGECIGTWGEYPNLDIQHNLSNEQKFSVFQGSLKVNGRGDRFVFGSLSVGLLDFGKLTDDSLTILRRTHLFSPTPELDGYNGREIVATGAHRVAFMDIAVSNKYVFCLYSHRIFESRDDLQVAFSGRSILVFDWAGNPIHHFQINYDLSSITLCELQREIYGIGHSDGEPVLVYGKLPDFIDLD